MRTESTYSGSERPSVKRVGDFDPVLESELVHQPVIVDDALLDQSGYQVAGSRGNGSVRDSIRRNEGVSPLDSKRGGYQDRRKGERSRTHARALRHGVALLTNMCRVTYSSAS